jgi:hypothetical protein
MMALSDATSIAAIGAIVALATTASPIILSVITANQRRKEKVEDYARQDGVAAQAREAARLLLAANERVARQSATSASETQSQLKQIHTLVNSNLTQEMEARLVALDAQLVLTQEVIRLNAAAGVEPTEAAKTALANLQRTADGLRLSLAERAAVTEAAADVRAVT